MTIQHIIPRLTAKPPFSVEVPGQKPVEGETPIRRHPAAVHEIVATPSPDITTVYELIRVSVAKLGDANCMGSRRLLRTHQETKKVKKIIDGEEQLVDKQWTYFELSGYEYLTYNQYQTRVEQIGAGFRKLGLAAGDRVHIFAATSANWLTFSHGAAFQSMPIVTAYDTLGQEGLRHSMVATGAKAIFLDPHLLATLTNVLKDATEIRHVIWNDQNQVKQEHIDKLKAAYPHINILSFEELRKLGEENPVEAVPPKPEDLCCIMYTSGSTGTPKGVPLLHRNVIAAGVFFSSFFSSSHCPLFPLPDDASNIAASSRRCQRGRKAVHWPWRRPAYLPPCRPHSRVRLRKRLALLGIDHGLRQP